MHITKQTYLDDRCVQFPLTGKIGDGSACTKIYHRSYNCFELYKLNFRID